MAHGGEPPTNGDQRRHEPAPISPQAVHRFREDLTRGEDVIDPSTWAGSVPSQTGIAPRIRIGRDGWFNLLWLLPIAFVVGIVSIAAAKGLRTMPVIERFIERYPGTTITAADRQRAGFPWWINLQHFFNLFLMMFIIRAGIQILSDHPRLYWTRHSTPGKEWFRIQKAVPDDPLWTAKQDSISLPKHVGLPGIRHSIGLARWWHLGADTLFLVNGLVFYILLFATSQWHRLVPTTWAVFPNALSTAIQYASLDWPAEHGWVAYNGLQLLAYFITVFVAGPAALLTGLGMSPALSTRFKRVSRVLSIQTARTLHFAVLVWFLVFIAAHVAMVGTTGARRNLNHMYAARDSGSWLGLWIFLASMVIVAVAWFAASPLTLRHPRWVQRAGFFLIGPVQRLFEHIDSAPGEYTDRDLSPYFWHNGHYPDSEENQALYDGDFADYRLHVGGLVEHPASISMDELRAMPYHEQTTQHFCIQGWSGVARWGGVSMQSILDLVHPTAEARWAVFYSLGDGPDEGTYYDAHPIEQMSYQLTMLAYDMNGAPLTFGHGAPLRLRNENQLGFKQVKWIKGIEFVADFAEVGGGYGGYNEDHEFFGYRQPI
jgi:thiosulfate reductase cytochrome b subunit